VVRHLYPHARVEDVYFHPPLIGRNKTTNDGMMLTNAALLEILGLLKPIDGGRYVLGSNALQRKVFMYGDALSVAKHSALHDKIFKGITRLGNKDYVETFLSAHERVFMQKGQFHQQIHQLGAIYQQFYGCFMQAFVAENRVKRVNGDPIKNGFQCHEQFAKKLYNACNRFMLRKMTTSNLFNDDVRITFQNDTERLRLILVRYQEYRLSWEQSDHEPSRMVALYLKSMRRYLRCDKSINKYDVWHLEIESAKLIAIWKTFGKPTYLKLQCEFMERCYNNDILDPVHREIMRTNSFCVRSSGRAVAFDEENENQNLRIKKTPKTDSLELSVKRSRHVVIGTKAAVELWGTRTKKCRE
jgi:hypothetical protein